MPVLEDVEARTEAESAARHLQRDILSGHLAPAAKLKIRELRQRYGIGASPMREALARLSARGFVQLSGQKGFRVAPVSHVELADITATRKIVEIEAIRLAIKNANAAWEDGILASFCLFERQVARFYDGTDTRLDAYEEKHQAFHNALIAACPLETLKSFCSELYVQTQRYRALNRRYGFRKETVIAEHRLLMKAVLSRKLPRALAAVGAHIGLTKYLADQIAEADVKRKEASPPHRVARIPEPQIGNRSPGRRRKVRA